MQHHRSYSFDKRGSSTWPGVGASLGFILLASVICFQSYQKLHGKDPLAEGSDEFLYKPMQPSFIGRNFKLRALEQQISDKAAEITHLKAKLRQAQAAQEARIADLKAQHTTVATVTAQIEQQRADRAAAHLSLAYKAAALDVCVQASDTLASEMLICDREVQKLQRDMQRHEHHHMWL